VVRLLYGRLRRAQKPERIALRLSPAARIQVFDDAFRE
jgi:hypothetical protein